MDKKFFQEFDQTDILDCKIRADLELLKRSNGLELDFDIKGNFIMDCDRCLEPVDIPVEYQEVLHIRFGEEEDLESEVVTLKRSAYELDLSQFLYELSMLALPMQRVHDYECLETSNTEEEDDDTDPRWEALKNINWNKE